MKIFIDENEVEVFSGAVIADILRSYSEKEYENITKGKKNIYDVFKNKVNLDGPVSEGSKFYIR